MARAATPSASASATRAARSAPSPAPSPAPGQPARKRARRSHAERSLATQLELIAATIRVIEEKGLERASTLEIAKAAGVTPGAIQHHFESKKDLILSAATELVHADDRHGSLFNWPAASEPLEARASQSITTLWKHVYSQARYVAMWNIFMACRTDSAVLQHLRLERRKLRGRLISNFLGCFPELEFANDKEAFAEIVFASLRGMGVVQLFAPAEPVNKRQLAALSRLIVDRCVLATSAAASNQPTFTTSGRAGARQKQQLRPAGGAAPLA